MTQNQQIVRWMAWSESNLARLIISEGLDVGLAQAICGPMVATYRLRLHPPSRTGLARLMSLAPAIGQAVQASGVRLSSSEMGVLVEIPLPVGLRKTPGAEVLARASRGLRLAIGMDNLRRPVLLDFQQPDSSHLLILGPSGKGKSQAIRSILYCLSLRNSPGQAVYLIMAKKREDWLAFQPAASCLAVLTEPKEQEQAMRWLAEELMEKRASHGSRMPHVFCVLDDLTNIQARASLTGWLEELSSLGRACGIHLILGSQSNGKQAGLSSAIEANLTARLIFGSPDGAAGSRYAGTGGLQLEKLGAPGDAVLVSGGSALRLATGFCSDVSIAQLPPGELERPWLKNRPEPLIAVKEQSEQAEQATGTHSQTSPTSGQKGWEWENMTTEQLRQNSLRLSTSRTPTEEERETIRELRARLGSDRRTILAAYGFYNGRTRELVLEALTEPGSQQDGKTASQYFEDSQEIDLTTEEGQELLAELQKAGLIQWPGVPQSQALTQDRSI